MPSWTWRRKWSRTSRCCGSLRASAATRRAARTGSGRLGSAAAARCHTASDRVVRGSGGAPVCTVAGLQPDLREADLEPHPRATRRGQRTGFVVGAAVRVAAMAGLAPAGAVAPATGVELQLDAPRRVVGFGVDSPETEERLRPLLRDRGLHEEPLGDPFP